MNRAVWWFAVEGNSTADHEIYVDVQISQGLQGLD